MIIKPSNVVILTSRCFSVLGIEKHQDTLYFRTGDRLSDKATPSHDKCASSPRKRRRPENLFPSMDDVDMSGNPMTTFL